MQEHILEVKDLNVSFNTYAGEVKAVRGVSFTLDEGEALAIVGESGCGKSVTSLAIMRLLPKRGNKVTGAVRFNGEDLLSLPDAKMRDRKSVV